MPEKVLVVTASLRKRSNSDALAAAFARGARDAGHIVDVVSLKGKEIHFCQGCLDCQKTQNCIVQDDAASLAQKIGGSDVVVFAAPVYYYGIPGQLKTLLDRCNPLYSSNYAFRKVYLLATAAEAEPSTVQGSIKGLQGWVDCFEKAVLAGTIFAGGVTEPGEIQNHPSLERAYVAGRSLAWEEFADFFAVFLTGCQMLQVSDETIYEKTASSQAIAPETTGVRQPEGEKRNMQKLQIKISEESYTVRLCKNRTAATFAEQLPLKVRMQELNGNEKYSYLTESLPCAAQSVSQVHAGDLIRNDSLL